jgi:hypothetical protein
LQKLQKWDQSFLQLPNIKQLFQKHYVPFQNTYECVYDSISYSDAFLINESERANKKEDPENLINQEKDADQLRIATIKEGLRQSLLSVASKLLGSQHLTLDQLSKEEQDLWNSYDNTDIYESLTGEKDTLPEFQFDWITTDPKICFPVDWKDLIAPPPQPKAPQQQPQQHQPVLQQHGPPQPQPGPAHLPQPQVTPPCGSTVYMSSA